MGVMRFVAYDEADLNGSPLGELTEAMSKHIDAEYNGTGGGDFQISRHSFTQTPWCRPGRYIRVWLDTISGDPDHSFFVNQSFDEVLGPDEDGIEVYRRQGNGPLYYLSDAMVPETSFTSADSAAPQPGSDQWVWPAGVHPAGVMVRMLEEAQAQGQLPDLTWDFSRTVDSNGAAWPTTVGEEFTLTVGTNLLEVIAVTQALGVVYKMDHDFVLHAYKSVDNEPTGADLSASVVFTKGVDVLDSAEREQVESPARSTMVVKGNRTDNGEIVYVRVDSAAGLAETIRPKIGFFDYGRTADFDTLQQVGFDEIYRKLRLKAGPTSISVLDPNSGGKRAFIDYQPGDQVTVNIPGTFNDVVKPITSIQLTETEAGEYDTVLGFDEDPARLEGPPTIVNGPAGVPDSGCCPHEGPFVPPGSGDDCSLAASATLHIGSHSAFGEPDPPDHNFAYSSDLGTTVSLATGFQYRELVTIAYNAPTTGTSETLDAAPFVYLAYPTGGAPANPPGPNGAIIDTPTWDWSESGSPSDGIDTASNGGFAGGYETGATFVSPWKTFEGPDVVADIIARGVPVSGFHGFDLYLDVRIEVRNGDGSEIDCGGDPVQTYPHEGQTAIEQSVGSGTTRFTNFPYTPGSLANHVTVGGVPVIVTETDPTTGEFELPFDPGSSPVVIEYQATSDHTGTGAGNIQPVPGTYPIPPELLPSAAGLPWFVVTDAAYGATGDGTTDDTEAIQAAIDDAEAAGGGVVYFPKGVYVIGGVLQDGSRGNAQLLLPSVDYVAGEQISIVLMGEVPPPTVFSVIGSTPLPDNHVILKGTLTSVSGSRPSVIGGWGPDTTLDFTNIYLRMQDIAIRLPENPVYSAADFSHVAAVDLPTYLADVSDYQIQGITEPTTSASYGLILPGLNNGALTRLGIVNVAGYYNGIEAGEHTYGEDVAAWGCKVALSTVAGYHPIHFDRFMAVHCERVIKATGGTAYLSIDQLNIEHAASGWWVTDYDVDDVSNYLKGRVEWKVTLAGVGHDSTWTVNGATNLLQNEMGTSPGGGGFSSPLTTRGDLLTRDASTHVRLGIGASGRFLRSNGTDPAWQTAALDDLSDVVISSPAAGQKLRYDGTNFVNANLHDEPMIASDGSVATDGLLNPMMHEVAW